MVLRPDDAAVRRPIDRRVLLKAGGLSVVGTAVLSACQFGPTGEEGGTAATTTTTEPSESDITIVRTATTLETLAIEVYERATAGGVLVTPELVEVAELLLEHHRAHQSLFAGETSKLGGEVTTDPNSALRSRLEGRIDAIGNEEDALRVGLDIERALAATYHANTTAVDAATLRVPIMSVGGVEARHATLLAGFLGEPLYPADGLHSTDGAIPPGT